MASILGLTVIFVIYHEFLYRKLIFITAVQRLQTFFPSHQVLFLTKWLRPGILAISSEPYQVLQTIKIEKYSGMSRFSADMLKMTIILKHDIGDSFSVVIKRKGFLRGSASGNLKIGIAQIDTQLFFQASDPLRAKYYFQRGEVAFLYTLSQNKAMRTSCTLKAGNETLSFSYNGVLSLSLRQKRNRFNLEKALELGQSLILSHAPFDTLIPVNYMQVCPKCKKRVIKGLRFCGYCGLELEFTG